jgi:hypothetical protein
MLNFDALTDRELLLEVKRHENIAKAGVAELMKRAIGEELPRDDT